MSLGGGDLQVILRRIRHGFIICDDTELCDKIISQDVEAEQRRRELAKSKAIDMEKTDLLNLLRTEPAFILDELSHSPEWTATNVQVQRVRCATLGRLDEIKTAKEVEQKTLRIPWQDPSRPKNADQPMHSKNGTDDDETSTPLFQRRTEPRQPLVQPSPLTALLQSGSLNQNPFAQYAKFDGTPNISANQSKRFVVHFKAQKLQTIVASVASVEEAIGFVCYKYTTENREPALTQTDPSKYSLYIADDFGQAEDDFPPLTHARPIGEYGFPHLALVEQPTTTSAVNSSTVAKPLNYDENSSEDGEIDDDSVDDSSQSITPPPSEPRRSVGSNEKPLSMAPAAAAAAAPNTQSEIDPINNLHRLYESLNQKSYHFDYYIKSGSSKHVKVRIDVSGEQVRFELTEKTSRLSWQSLLLTTQRLVDCTLPVKESNKKRDRTRIYLVFDIQQESDGSRAFQTYEFESTVESAEGFRDQILNIIQLKNPHGREAYEEQQQSRRDPTKKRRSIFNIIGSGIGNSGSSAKS